jgi:outer membrane lipoprotein-sorting protein
MMTFIMVKVLLILILTGQLGFCLQASSRGHAQESANGILTFPFTRNQFTTSLSSLQAAYEMRKELLEYQRDFYVNAKKKKQNKSLYIRR